MVKKLKRQNLLLSSTAQRTLLVWTPPLAPSVYKGTGLSSKTALVPCEQLRDWGLSPHYVTLWVRGGGDLTHPTTCPPAAAPLLLPTGRMGGNLEMQVGLQMSRGGTTEPAPCWQKGRSNRQAETIPRSLNGSEREGITY